MAIRPVQFSDSSPVTQTRLLLEDRVAQLEREAEDFLRGIPKDKHQDYRLMVRRSLGHIRTQITIMRALGKSDYEINKALPELFGIFYATRNRFMEENKVYSENQSMVWNEHRATAHKIDQCIQDYDGFEPEFSMEDDEPGYLKDPVQENHFPEHSVASDQLHKVADAISILHASGNHLPKKVTMLGKAAMAVADIMENPTGPVSETLLCETGVKLLEETANIAIAGGSTLALCASIPLTLPAAVPASVVTAIGAYRGMQKVSAPAAKELKKVCHRSFEQLREKTVTAKAGQAQTSFQGVLQDKVMEKMVAARMVAAASNAVGTALKEGATVVLGCRGEEGKKNCKAVLDTAKTVVKETAAIALGCRGSKQTRNNCKIVQGYIRDGMTKAKPALERMAGGQALTQSLEKFGISNEEAQQYLEDSRTIRLMGGGGGTAMGAVKLLRRVFPLKVPLPSLNEKCLSAAQQINHNRQRIVAKETPLLPEDIGLHPDVFHHPYYNVKGSMKIQDNTLVVHVDRVFGDGTSRAVFNMAANLRQIAVANKVKALQLETDFSNERLKAIIAKRYGGWGDHTLEDLTEGLDGHQVFRIPISSESHT